MLYKDFLRKIENKESFSEREIEDFFWEDLLEDEDLDIEEVDCQEGECRRWSHIDVKTFRINDRYFQVCGDIGSTEMQENYFFESPIEVVPEEEWIKVTNYYPVR